MKERLRTFPAVRLEQQIGTLIEAEDLAFDTLAAVRNRDWRLASFGPEQPLVVHRDETPPPARY